MISPIRAGCPSCNPSECPGFDGPGVLAWDVLVNKWSLTMHAYIIYIYIYTEGHIHPQKDRKVNSD